MVNNVLVFGLKLYFKKQDVSFDFRGVDYQNIYL